MSRTKQEKTLMFGCAVIVATLLLYLLLVFGLKP